MQQTPIVLAIDTASAVSAVALCSGAAILAEDNSAAPDDARHGAVLLPRIQRLLAAAGVALRDVDLIGVGVGPGSFTGLRVGLATAKGLAFALHKPVRGVSSIEVLAAALLQRADHALVLVDAFKGELYAGLFARSPGADPIPRAELALFHAPPAELLARTAPVLAALPSATTVLACGDGLRRYAGDLTAAWGTRVLVGPAELDQPRAALLAQRALADFQQHGPSDLATLEPTYVRDSDARLPERALRL
jgi:tRNA threonylcarbamoyladenosine biosynthesis protein TsaB